MHRKAGLLLIALVALPMAALAQNAPPTRIRGTLDSVTPNAINVSTPDGAHDTIALTDQTRYLQLKPLSISDVKAGAYVGVTSKVGADGKPTAIAINVFPESARGAGEGQRPWDLDSNSTMTNATVAEVAAVDKGSTLKLTFNGGSADIVMPPDVPVTTFAPSDKTILTPGAKVTVFAAKAADGTLTANAVSVAGDDVKKPM